MEQAHALSPEEVTQVLLANRARFLEFLASRVGSRDLAEEILQDAMVRAVERVGQVREGENVVAWFFRVLRNAVTDVYRRRGASHRALEQFAREVETTGPSDTVERQVCQCIGWVLETLKPEYQAPIRAIDLEGGDVPAFATATGLTANNAGVRLHRARRALAERLRSVCGACAGHGCLDCSCRRTE